MKPKCQSIYGNIKKRKSSTPSCGKSCFNITPANDGPGYVSVPGGENPDITQPSKAAQTAKQ